MAAIRCQREGAEVPHRCRDYGDAQYHEAARVYDSALNQRGFGGHAPQVRILALCGQSARVSGPLGRADGFGSSDGVSSGWSGLRRRNE